MIDIDLTVIIQFINFLITLFVLDRLLIRPVREQIAKRRGILTELKKSADELNSRADTLLVNYRSIMDDARKSGAKICADARSTADADGATIKNKASNEAHEIIRSAAEATAASADESRTALRSQLSRLAQNAIDKLTDTTVKTA